MITSSSLRRTGLESLTAGMLLGGVALISGCQAGRTFVLTPASERVTVMGVSVREVETSVRLSEAERGHFERVLRERLRREGELGEGDDLTIEYRVVLREEGSGATRVGAALVSLTGVPTGQLGAGNLGIDAVFKDRAGREVARIVADGPIDGPGGTIRGGLATAAASIAKFTKESFGKARLAGM